MMWQTVGAAETGQSFSAIAACFGITKSEASRLVAEDRQTGNIKDLPISGRPKVTTEREDHDRAALQKASFESQRRRPRRNW